MPRGALPNPFERLRRSPVAVIGLIVVAGVAVAMASVAERAVVRIEGEVSANWRGAYDLLVRPPGTRLDLERTNGLVEPNFVGFAGTGGISLDQLEAIRRLPGVELAAPVGFVGYVRYGLSSPAVHLPAPPTEPTLFRLTLSVTTNDGLHELLVERQSGLVLLGPAAGPDEAVRRWVTNFGGITAGERSDGSMDAVLSAAPLPAIASPIMAVDPAAEMALLGPSSSFMARLRDLPAASRTAKTFDLGVIPDGFDWSRSLLRGAAKSEVPAVQERPVVPLIVSDRIYASLRLRLDVDQLGAPLRDYPPGESIRDVLGAALAQAGSSVAPVGSVTTDLTSSLRPLQLVDVSVAWPGAAGVERVLAYSAPRDFSAGLPTRPQYRGVASRPGSDASLSFEITPLGIVGPDGGSPQESSMSDPLALELTTGRESAYRQFRQVPLVAAEGFSATEPGDQPFFFAPLGEFDLSQLELPTETLSYVPFGAYDPPKTEWLDGADATSRTRIWPTLNPLGLIMVPPLAITDLAGAVVLRGDRPIDAIRVRVAGVSGFTPESRARVERVAELIVAMGLDVDVVAGSSPQAVDVYVPGYLVHDGQTEDLGWVRQEWTTLGAAERVARGLGEGAIALLALGVLSAVILAATVQAFRATTRRRELAVLAGSGWSRGDVSVWVMAEAVVAAAIVLGLGLVVWLVSGAAPLSGVAVVVVAAALVGGPAVFLATQLGAIDAPGFALRFGEIAHRTPRLPGVRGPITLGIRHLTSHPARTLVLILALAGMASALSLVGSVVAEASLRAGPTRLASVVVAVVEPSLFVTLGAVATANTVALLVVWHLDARSRAGEAATLIAAGWSRRQVLLSRVTAGFVASLPAAAVGAAITTLGALAIAGANPLASAAVTAALAPALGTLGPLVVGVPVDPTQP